MGTTRSSTIKRFSVLTLENMKNITFDTYQLKFSSMYIQNKIQKDNNKTFEVDMFGGTNRLPLSGLFRVRVFSKFRNAGKYQV